jgi:predicted phosphohydrolase
MRILVSADLHYQPSQRDAYVEFAEWVAAQAPDCFILAGDVGHPLRLFQRGLQLFAGLRCPKLVIAGNHDLYRSDYDSRTLWEAHLPAVARAEGFHWLEEASMRLGDTGICGTLGWYDYSARAEYLPFAADAYRYLKKLVNHDADYIDWPWSDRAMARYLGKRFAARLAALEADQAVRRIVVVTHVPIFAHALPDYPQSELYSLQRAYLGNFTLGEVVRSHRKVTHVVSGHLHRHGSWQVAAAGGQINFAVIGSQKGRPAATLLHLPGEAAFMVDFSRVQTSDLSPFENRNLVHQ